jgi:hypothetical protein
MQLAGKVWFVESMKISYYAAIIDSPRANYHAHKTQIYDNVASQMQPAGKV